MKSELNPLKVRARVPANKGGGPAAFPKGDLALEVLRFEYSSRLQKNPSYSMRAFARFLGVSHALLSLILGQRRPPSASLVEKMCERLCLDPAQRLALLESVARRKNKLAVNPSAKSNSPEKFTRINLDQFALLSEWQHYAILSLLEIPDTKLTPEFVAERLGISVLLARISLARLFEMELIVKDPKTKRWCQSTEPIVVENTESTSSTRKFQRQMLNKALESLDNDPMALRDLSSTTFAMDPKHVGYALQRIREFRRQLTRELEALGTPLEVYNLTVQIFPTSKRKAK